MSSNVKSSTFRTVCKWKKKQFVHVIRKHDHKKGAYPTFCDDDLNKAEIQIMILFKRKHVLHIIAALVGEFVHYHIFYFTLI